MRTEAQIQVDLTRCYNAIAEITTGGRVNKFTFASAESQQSYEMINPSLPELETYRDNLLIELATLQNTNSTARLTFTKSYFNTAYSKFD